MACPACLDVSTRDNHILALDVHVKKADTHGLLRRSSTIHPLTKTSKTAYHKQLVKRWMRGWTLEYPHGTLFRLNCGEVVETFG